MDPVILEKRVAKLEKELEQLQLTFGILLDWMTQSANSPIRRDEANRLVTMMYQGMKHEDDE